MPNRNHGAYLRRSLGAILAQTRPADEIIIIDDASNDDSLAVIDEFASRAPSIKLIRNRRQLGVVPNLNVGLSEARGDQIAFAGSDDVIFPSFLSEASTELDRYPQAGFTAACVEIWGGQGEIRGYRPLIHPSIRSMFIDPDRFRKLLAKGDHFFVGTVTLYRRSALMELGGFDPELRSFADGVVARRIAARHGFCFIPRPLGVWRIHEANYSIEMATSPQEFEPMLRNVHHTLRSEPIGFFPEGYAKVLDRRLRFGAARLILSKLDPSEAATYSRIAEVTHAARIDLRVFRLSRIFGPMRRRVMLAWLALRMRPYSFIFLAFEQLRQWLARLSESRRMISNTQRDEPSARR